MHARRPGLVPEAWELPLDRAKQEALWKPQQHFGTAAAAADPQAHTAVTAPGRAAVGGKRSAAELDGVTHQVTRKFGSCLFTNRLLSSVRQAARWWMR